VMSAIFFQAYQIWQIHVNHLEASPHKKKNNTTDKDESNWCIGMIHTWCDKLQEGWELKDKIGNGKLLPWYVSEQMHKSVNVDNFLPDLIDTTKTWYFKRKLCLIIKRKANATTLTSPLTRSYDMKNSCSQSHCWVEYIYSMFPHRHWFLNLYSCYTHCFLNPTGIKVQIGMQFPPSLHIQHLHWQVCCRVE
jgi:hypothetical protein